MGLAISCLRGQALDSRRLANSSRSLSRRAWFFPGCCRRCSRFWSTFKHRWQLRLRLFLSSMMAVLQRLNAGSFFLYSLLSIFIFLALVLKVCRDRFSCHGQSVAELLSPNCPILATRWNSWSAQQEWPVGSLSTKHSRSIEVGAFGPRERMFGLAIALLPWGQRLQDLSRTAAEVRDRSF
jgi:hypothetical protein